MTSPRRDYPEIERDCPKCGHTHAQGPEYRRGVGSDADLGEHLRFYCTACRYMTYEPTRDQDSPARRQELAEAFARRQQGWVKTGSELPDPDASRARRVPSSRRSQGWK